MKNPSFILRGLVLALAWGTRFCAAQAAEGEAPRWEPRDFTFNCTVEPTAPFGVKFSAELTGPNGAKLTIPGFYDGPRTWKVRAAPLAEGRWSLTTQCDIAELNHQMREFVCVKNPLPAIHGGLAVDPAHRHQFAFEDGTHFLPAGYECDWLWALDANDPQLKTLNPFLDKLTANGFNYIILNAYAHDTTWRKGKTADDDFGPPPIYAWKGTNEKPDHAQFDLAYWQHYDRVIDAMYRRGIIAHVLMRVYNKGVKWPANGSPEDDQYFRWLIARYAAYPNVTWDLSKEAQNEKDLNYKTDRLRFIRGTDPYHRLLTVHDDRAIYDRGAYDELVDYRSDQQHTKWRETMLDHLHKRDWPVINTEFGYEQGPGGAKDKTYNVAQPAEEVCRRAWEVYMAGGSGVYYYTYTAWDVLRPKETPPGYAYFKHLHNFFAETGFWRMTPTEGISSDGYCLAEAGREYVVFLNASKVFSMKLEGLAAPLDAEWYHPFSGERKSAGSAGNGTDRFTPPAAWGDVPVALHVGKPR